MHRRDAATPGQDGARQEYLAFRRRRVREEPAAAAPALRAALALPAAAVLAALVVSPVLRTGYLSDDVVHSSIQGSLVLSNDSLPAYLVRLNAQFFREGRFYPLQFTWVMTAFYLVGNLTLYKAGVVAAVALNVLTFGLFVRQVTRDAPFAAFAALLTAGLFQFRAYHDPLLSFAAMMPFVFQVVVGSLMALQRHLDTGRRRWLVAAAAAYLVAVLTYEMTYPLVLLHAGLVAAARRGWRERLRLIAPFAAAVGFCFVMTVGSRLTGLQESSAYRINPNPAAYARTLAWQVTSALPLSYGLVDPAGLFPRPWEFAGAARFAAGWGALAVFLGVTALGLRCLRAGAGGARPDRAVVTGLGLGWAVLPAVLLALSVKYQAEVGPGKGYIAVYLQAYGVALLGASAVWRLRASPRGRAAVACAVGAVAALTFQANTRVAVALSAAPGTPGYNRAAWEMAGACQANRDMLAAALGHGLFDDVPDLSWVVRSQDYDYWYTRELAPFFFAAQTGKRLASPSAADPESRAVAPRVPFALTDVCRGPGDGYVVLSREPSAFGPGVLTVFVRHPRLFAAGATPTLLIEGADRGGTGPYTKRGDEVAVVRSGRDWALVSLRDDLDRVDPSSLVVTAGPVATLWSEGFGPPDSDRDSWWRRSPGRGVLILRNLTDSPRGVWLKGRVDGPAESVAVTGPAFRTVVRTGPVRVLCLLPPGTHAVAFEAVGGGGFGLADFVLEDVGPPRAASAGGTVRR